MKLNFLKKFVGDESGASMVEYGLALLVVTGIGVGAMSTIGANTGVVVGAACDVVAGGGVAGLTDCEDAE